jgi:hypothetical protein
MLHLPPPLVRRLKNLIKLYHLSGYSEGKDFSVFFQGRQGVLGLTQLYKL